MKIAIVYASETGNTAQIAQAIREGCQGHEIVAFGPLPRDVGEAELIFVGSWTDKGTCAPAVKEFLQGLHGKRVALFGTAGFGLSEMYFASLSDRFRAEVPRKIRCWVPGSVRGGCPLPSGLGMRLSSRRSPATPGWRTCSGPMTRPCPTPTGRTWRMRGPLQPLCWPNKKELRHKGMAL